MSDLRCECGSTKNLKVRILGGEKTLICDNCLRHLRKHCAAQVLLLHKDRPSRCKQTTLDNDGLCSHHKSTEPLIWWTCGNCQFEMPYYLDYCWRCREYGVVRR